MDEPGSARIVDFGLTTVTHNPDSMRSASQHNHTPRWTAPEVLLGGVYSKEADIFSFAMVVIEVCHDGSIACRTWADCCFILIQVFTGAVPFIVIPSHMAMLAIMQGTRPPRPAHVTFTEDLWVLTKRCWNQEPRSRPGAPGLLQVLHTLLVSRWFQYPYVRYVDGFLVCSEQPSWKQLIDRASTMGERVSLIATIFSDRRQVEMVEHLSGDDAQTFIDRIDEVRLHTVMGRLIQT